MLPCCLSMGASCSFAADGEALFLGVSFCDLLGSRQYLASAEWLRQIVWLVFWRRYT